ncbi:hypothetical protein [Streptomyces marincola]|uniref:Uncharacterized protein n=1 Tax=Streptomyces marincola TaxID=2878388 RepID=A0A1W7CRT9_9ACTN|nr:hypothetical protein [Streptomyces marincola]ARQ67465.1 hypothetical protein CAG99_00160 [Streptomyces marincola]UCM91577.1 hypothetical protein LC193_28505 [Streptomyces marincola]
MSRGGKVAIGAVAAGLVLWALTNFWIAALVIFGVPAAAYLMLDAPQRRRLRRAGRKELGR